MRFSKTLQTLTASFVIIFLFLILSSCVPIHERNNLLKIEQQLEDNPEYALKVLDSINPDHYKSRELKALYSLLKSRAYDKNLIDIDNDSIINPALEYYANSSDKYHRMKAEYYRGIVNQNANRNENAMEGFLNAYETAEEIKEPLWQGLSAKHISRIFNKTVNSHDALEFAKKSYHCYVKLGIDSLLDYPLLNLCIEYNNHGDYDSCVKYAEKLININEKINKGSIQKWYKSKAIESIGISAIKAKDYDKAIKVLESTGLEDVNPNIKYYLALAYLYKGDIAKGRAIINNNDSLKNSSETVDLSFLSDDLLKYNLYSLLDNRDSAFACLRILYDRFNENFKKRQASNLSVGFMNYHKNRKELDEAKIKAYRFKIIFISVVSFLLLVIIAITGYYYIKRQREIRDELTRSAEALTDKVKEFEEENIQLGEALQNMLASNFKIVKDACETLNYTPDKKMAEKKLADNMNSLIKSLSKDPKKIKELEELVNRNYGNIMHNLRNDYPDLTKDDYRFIIYNILGFDVNSCARLMETTPKAIYSRRARIKAKIQSSNITRKYDYLKILV